MGRGRGENGSAQYDGGEGQGGEGFGQVQENSFLFWVCWPIRVMQESNRSLVPATGAGVSRHRENLRSLFGEIWASTKPRRIAADKLEWMRAYLHVRFIAMGGES
jgi:hypothetical protein